MVNISGIRDPYYLLSRSKRIDSAKEILRRSDSECLSENSSTFILKLTGAKVNFQSFSYVITRASG